MVKIICYFKNFNYEEKTLINEKYLPLAITYPYTQNTGKKTDQDVAKCKIRQSVSQ